MPQLVVPSGISIQCGYGSAWYIMLSFSLTSGLPVVGMWVRLHEGEGFSDGIFSGWTGSWWADNRGIMVHIDSTRFDFWFIFDGHVNMLYARSRAFHSHQPQLANGIISALTLLAITDPFVGPSDSTERSTEISTHLWQRRGCTLIWKVVRRRVAPCTVSPNHEAVKSIYIYIYALGS